MAGEITRFVDYDATTGRIVVARSMPTEHLGLNPVGVGLSRLLTESSVDPNIVYVSGGELTPRPTLAGFDKTEIQANGTDVAKLLLPEPMKFKLDGEEAEFPTAILELVTDMPASWVIEIDHFPYQKYRAEIVAA